MQICKSFKCLNNEQLLTDLIFRNRRRFYLQAVHFGLKGGQTSGVGSFSRHVHLRLFHFLQFAGPQHGHFGQIAQVHLQDGFLDGQRLQFVAEAHQSPFRFLSFPKNNKIDGEHGIQVFGLLVKCLLEFGSS